MIYFLFAVELVMIIYLFSKVNHLERLLEDKPKSTPDTTPKSAPWMAVPTPPPVAPSVPRPPIAPQVVPVAPSTPNDFEFKLGSKVFTAIGVIAVMLGLGFFLRYAFERDLITEVMRVVMGGVGGAALLGIGYFLRTKYSAYAHVLSGGGLALWYITTFSAFQFYHLIGFGVAFALLVVITAVGIALSLAYDSFPLQLFAQIGGFLSPLLIASSFDHPHALFLYLIVLNLGISFVTLKKPWSQLVLGNLIGTVIVFLSWFFLGYSHAQFDVFLFYSTVFFVIFLASTVASQLIHRPLPRAIDLIITIATPLLYFAIVYSQLDILYPDYRIVFTLILAAVYALLGISFQRMVSWGIALFFFIISVPIAFDRNIITIAWALQATLIVLISRYAKISYFRTVGLSLFVLVLLRFLALDSSFGALSSAWTNDRFITALFITFSYVCSVFIMRGDQSLPTRTGDVSALILGVYFVPLFAVSAEVIDFYPDYWLSVAWSLFGLVGLLIGIKFLQIPLRVLTYVTLLVAGLRIIAFEGMEYRLELAIVLAVCLGIALWFMRRRTDDALFSERPVMVSVFFVAIYALLVWALSFEIYDYYSAYLLSILWSLAGVIALLLGAIFSQLPLRIVAYLALLMSTFRIIGFEPFEYRLELSLFLAICIAVILWLMKKFTDKISSDEQKIVAPGLFVAMNGMLFWSISMEVSDRIVRPNLQRVMLSVTWTLYAALLLVWGIISKSGLARAMALGLFCVVILKVFLYDTASLSDLYRFISFITLGVILLITGFLFYRYKDRIQQFIKAE